MECGPIVCWVMRELVHRILRFGEHEIAAGFEYAGAFDARVERKMLARIVRVD